MKSQKLWAGWDENPSIWRSDLDLEDFFEIKHKRRQKGNLLSPTMLPKLQEQIFKCTEYITVLIFIWIAIFLDVLLRMGVN